MDSGWANRPKENLIPTLQTTYKRYQFAILLPITARLIALSLGALAIHLLIASLSPTPLMTTTLKEIVALTFLPTLLNSLTALFLIAFIQESHALHRWKSYGQRVHMFRQGLPSPRWLTVDMARLVNKDMILGAIPAWLPFVNHQQHLHETRCATAVSDTPFLWLLAHFQPLYTPHSNSPA